MSAEKTTWGYQNDTDSSLQSKSGGKFGLNKAFITKLEYNPNAGADEGLADAVDITVMVGEKEFRSRIYDITGGLFKGDNKIEEGEPGYNELYNVEKAQREAVIVHAVKALGTTEAQIVAALQAGNVTSFATWAVAMCSTKPADFATRPVDAFVEYQWEIKPDNEITFLQLPKNMKGGRFLCPAVTPSDAKLGWVAENGADGLRYVDAGGNEHPFTRSANYMESPKSYQQKEGEESGPANTTSDAGEAADKKPAKSTWG